MPPQIPPATLLERYGQTYADEAGITLRDEPRPLFQLLVLAMMSSIPISADIAAAASRELFQAGWRTPARMLGSTWQERVDAVGRGGYRRYDESTADNLELLATQVGDLVGGDLRAWRPEDHDGVAALEDSLQSFIRIGPTGAAIFCREVQAVWPSVRPYFDRRAIAAARTLGYPTTAEKLAALVDVDEVTAFSAALVRWSLDQ